MVSELGIRSKRPERATTDRVKLYPKKTLLTLREIDLSTPLDDGWFTLADIINKTNQPKALVKSLVKKVGIQGEERRSISTGIIRLHYPPEILDKVIESIERLPQPAGTWLTYYEIAALVKKSAYWVEKKIGEKYPNKGEPRLDNRNQVSIHYPLEVIEGIKKEAEELKKYPESGDYLTLYGLSVRVGKKIGWVKDRLQFITVETEKRIDGRNCVNDHYPPETVDKLLMLPEDILEQNQPQTKESRVKSSDMAA